MIPPGRQARHTMAVLAIAPVVLLSSAVVATPAEADTTCAQAVARRPVYAAPGWTITCTTNLPHGWLGATSVSTRTIKIRTNQTNPLVTLGHELAHAYSYSEMTAALRTQFARRLGYATFLSGSYYNRPAEVWANNQARCHGIAIPTSYKRVSCVLIREFEKKAQAT